MPDMRLIRLIAIGALLLSGCTRPATQPTPQIGVMVTKAEFGNGADRPLPTYIYHPPAGAGRHPLVLFSHGYTCHPEDYDALLRAWAEAGFVVAAPVYPFTSSKSSTLDIADLARQPADVSALITAILALDTTPNDPLSGRLDPGKVAVGGHSLGGMTSLGLISSFARDKRVSAAIILAGSARTVGTTFPDPGPSALFVHGDADTVVKPAEGREAYAAYPGRKAWLPLKYGDHRGPFFGTQRDDAAVATRATTDYLLWSLRGDASALKRLDSTVDIENKLS